MPFEVVMDPDMLQEWDVFLEPFFYNKPLNKNKSPIKIMKYVIMKYLSNGAIMCSQTYNESYDIFSIWKHAVQCYNNVCTEKSPRPEINKKKLLTSKDFSSF